MEIFNINYRNGREPLPTIQDNVSRKLPELYSYLSNVNSQEEGIMRFLLEYLKISGFLAKVAEELDHMFMEINRQQVEREIIKMVNLHLLTGKIWNLRYWIRVPNRWDEIEEKRIV